MDDEFFGCLAVRENVKAARKEFDKTEDDLKALQSVGQIIGEVLRQLDSERCEFFLFCSWAPFRVAVYLDWTPLDHWDRKAGRGCLIVSVEVDPCGN